MTPLSASAATQDISITTQPLSSDTTKSRRPKACCTEANGHITKCQLAIKVKTEKTDKQQTTNKKPKQIPKHTIE